MTPGTRTFSLTVTVVAHAAVIAALLQIDAVRKPLLEAVPIMVELIKPPEVKLPPEPPKVVPPRPRPERRKPEPQPVERPAEAPQLLAAETPAPSPIVAPTPPKAEPAPAPAVAPPPPVVPPSYNAAYLKNPPPAYPILSRRRGEKGTVVLRVHVSPQGAADQVMVHTSSGHGLLDDAALEAVRQWRFVPARQGEQPLAAWVLVPIVFKLEN